MKAFLFVATVLGLSVGLKANDESFLRLVGQWTDQGFFLTKMSGPLQFVDGKRIRVMPHPKPPFSLPPDVTSIPSYGGRGFVVGDTLFLTTYVGLRIPYRIGNEPFVAPPGDREPTALLWGWKEGRWQEVASLKLGQSRRPNLLPLQNGKFLVLFPPDEKVEPGQPAKPPSALFGIAHRDDRGELLMQSWGDLGVRGALADEFIQDAFRWPAATAMVGDHLFVGCSHYGVFWVFSLRDGSLRRTLQLYDVPVEEMVRKGVGAPLFLNLQPMKDGTLLVSARDGAIQESLAKAWRASQVPLQGLPDTAEEAQAVLRLQKQRMEEVFVQFPLVKWFELDPDLGQVKRLPTGPPGTPDVAPTLSEAKGFYWLPGEDGRVRMVDSSLPGYTVEAWKPSGPAREKGKR